MRGLIVTFSLGALMVSLGACQRDRSERLAESYSTVSKPTYREVPRPSPQSATGLDAISVEEDYEERAASTITAANLSAQLVELEKELGQ